jgi:hypothetical protein
MRCPQCDLQIFVGLSRRISTGERDADEDGPRAFVIIVGDRLIHRCALRED